MPKRTDTFSQAGLNEAETPLAYGEDFQSSGNLLFTAKTLVVKRTFTADDNESYFQSGQRLYFKGVFNTGYSVLRTDYLVGISTTANAVTVNLPPASLSGVGKTFLIKDIGGSAGSNLITVDPDGAETIDGDVTKGISANYMSLKLACDGSNWYII